MPERTARALLPTAPWSRRPVDDARSGGECADNGASTRIMRRGAVLINRHTLAALAALAIAPSARAQQLAGVPAPARAIVESIDGGASAQIGLAERGEAVVRALPTTDRDEVAFVAMISVDAPRAFFTSLGMRSNALISPPTRAELGGFGVTPGIVDLGAFSLSTSDIHDLRKCRPLHCAIKLPSEAMAVLSQAAANGGGTADSLTKEWLAGVVRSYAADGDSALPVYDDTRAGERSGEGAARLLAEDSLVLRSAPALAAYLGGAPDDSVAGVQTRFYWSVDRPSGLVPILSAMQLSTYAPADSSAPAFVVSKQIYANHYFDARLDVAALTDGPTPTPSTLVVLVRRVRFDHLASGGLFDLRGRVVRKLRDALRGEMVRTKQLVEQAYRERETP